VLEVVAAETVADPIFCPHVVFTIVDVIGSCAILFTNTVSKLNTVAVGSIILR
jgi:hypothetical protein